MTATTCESMDYAFSRASGALTRMNQYEVKVQGLRRELEQSQKIVDSCLRWREEVYLHKRPQQALHGASDARPQRVAQLDRMEELERRVRRLERLTSQRGVDVGVQAGVRQPTPCHSCHAWWAAPALALGSACLLVGGLLNALWSGRGRTVVINIGQQPF